MSNSALVVIDFINDIANTQSEIAGCAAHCEQVHAIDAANKSIAWARANQHMVVQVKVGFDKSYHLQPEHSPIFGQAKEYNVFQLDTWGTDFHPDLDVQDTDLVIEKPRVNPFYATQLDAAFRAKGIKHVYVCGVSTSLAIQSMVRDGHDRDYQMYVIEDACAAHDQAEHDAGISLLTRISEIVKSADLK